MPNYNTTLQSNNTDLQTVLQTLQTKAAGSAQATPVISINSANGLITATAGTKTSTHQLAFQPAKTITPSTASQIAVSSGYYTGGSITVAAVPTQSKTVTPTSTTQNVTPDSGKFLSKVTVNGDSDLVAGNIKSGVNIFGVTGTYAGSSGGDTSGEDGLIARNLTSYTNDRVTTIGASAFNYYTSLTTVSFSAAKSIGTCAFYSCTGLTTVNFPAATMISDYAFCKCSRLATVSFPAVKSIGKYTFERCSSLTTVSLPNANFINTSAFASCINLKSLYLTGSSICRLSDSKVFIFTPLSAEGIGSIYVPSSLLTSYKTATNWTYYSSKFVGI